MSLWSRYYALWRYGAVLDRGALVNRKVLGRLREATRHLDG